MNSFNSDSIIYIRGEDGSRTMFSAGELRERLSGSLGAETAEDIALAVEYSLLNRQNRSTELLFDRGELDEAVIRLLEETGFPDAAAEYRSNNDFKGETLEGNYSDILQLLGRHLGCSGNMLEQVTEKVVDASHTIGIEDASPHLYLELARHFAKRMSTSEKQSLPSLPEFDRSCLENLPQMLTKQSAGLIEQGVFSVDGLTSIFPCVRFYVNMRNFSSYFDVSSPVTELFVYPAVLCVGSALEECRLKLQKTGSTDSAERILPCTLEIRDLRQFVREAFECSSENAIETISSDIGNLFSSELGGKLFKLDFD